MSEVILMSLGVLISSIIYAIVSALSDNVESGKKLSEDLIESYTDIADAYYSETIRQEFRKAREYHDQVNCGYCHNNKNLIKDSRGCCINCGASL
jgi:hypothetical protein